MKKVNTMIRQEKTDNDTNVQIHNKKPHFKAYVNRYINGEIATIKTLIKKLVELPTHAQVYKSYVQKHPEKYRQYLDNRKIKRANIKAEKEAEKQRIIKQHEIFNIDYEPMDKKQAYTSLQQKAINLYDKFNKYFTINRLAHQQEEKLSRSQNKNIQLFINNLLKLSPDDKKKLSLFLNTIKISNEEGNDNATEFYKFINELKTFSDKTYQTNINVISVNNNEIVAANFKTRLYDFYSKNLTSVFDTIVKNEHSDNVTFLNFITNSIFPIIKQFNIETGNNILLKTDDNRYYLMSSKNINMLTNLLNENDKKDFKDFIASQSGSDLYYNSINYDKVHFMFSIKYKDNVMSPKRNKKNKGGFFNYFLNVADMDLSFLQIYNKNDWNNADHSFNCLVFALKKLGMSDEKLNSLNYYINDVITTLTDINDICEHVDISINLHYNHNKNYRIKKMFGTNKN